MFSARALARQLPVQRRHRGGELVEREQPGLEYLPLVEHKTVEAAGQGRLEVRLGLVPEAAAQLHEPPDADSQPGLLADLAHDRVLEPLAPPGEPAREPPWRVPGPQPVPQ